MKPLKLLFAYILLTTFVSCVPPVTFTEPQPADTRNLAKFPKRLQGQYVSLLDHSVLIISDKRIQRVYDYDYTFHPNQLDSTTQLSGDTLIDRTTHEKTAVRREGDSLIAHIHYTDTLFQLDSDHVVRKFKGYYFLNTCYDTESWEVKKMQLSKGRLVISSISTTEDLDDLSEITETPTDTVPPYKFKATKKQFREFVRQDGFSDSETFVRLKK